MPFDTPVSKRKPAEAVKAVAPPRRSLDDAPVKPARPRLRVVSDRTSSAVSGILAQLDEDQRAAADIVDGPLLIVAGPGSGKTRTLTYRIAHLVAERGAAAESCLAITFTRRAAGEMRERLHACSPTARTRSPSTPSIRSASPSCASTGARPALVRTFGSRARPSASRCSRDTGLSAHKAERLLRAISREKRRRAGRAPRQRRRGRPMPARWRGATGSTSTTWSRRRSASWCRMPRIAASRRDRYRWISVDEFQDVDEQQYRLLTLLAPPDGNSVPIGDPNQAIYGFRGADASCFDRFRQDYPAARTVRLARNYRSTGTIVTASAQVIPPPRPGASRSPRSCATCTSASPSRSRRRIGPRPSRW